MERSKRRVQLSEIGGKDGDGDSEDHSVLNIKNFFWHGGSAWDAWFSCSSNQVAQVLLTLPYSFSQLGMASGIVLQIFYGLLGSWTAYLISVLYVEYRARKEKENVNFKNHVIQAVMTLNEFGKDDIFRTLVWQPIAVAAMVDISSLFVLAQRGDDDRFSAFMLFRITVYRHPYLGGAVTSGVRLHPWRMFRNVSISADLSLVRTFLSPEIISASCLHYANSKAALHAVFAHIALSRKGFVLRLCNPFHDVDNKSLSSKDTSKMDAVADEPVAEYVKEVDVTTKAFYHTIISQHKWEEGKLGRVVVPVSADATQQEALLWLKNLKEGENDDQVIPNSFQSIVNEYNVVENSPDDVENSPRKMENSLDHLENYNVQVENSPEISPKQLENSHVHVENSHVHVENSLEQMENSSVHVENSYAHVENSHDLSGVPFGLEKLILESEKSAPIVPKNMSPAGSKHDHVDTLAPSPKPVNGFSILERFKEFISIGQAMGFGQRSGMGDGVDVAVVVLAVAMGVMTMVVLWSGGGEAVVVEWVVTVARGGAWEGRSDRSGDGDQFWVRPEKSRRKSFPAVVVVAGCRR
ncbi:auxin transporter-like protein 4 [Tanacetum coccineum]|uniref:Auxin transporter-like protein 4 n=1 Tax=Tanacetum coccineum TaxID=301880 RepID=A0ABQ5A2S1_9ASTR